MSDQMEVIHGDCLDIMRSMEPASVNAIVTDPPYGLGFMGKNWDHGIPGVPFWEAALIVAKPGAHLLAFGGTRTHHRLMCAIEDAGWEIRDCLMWVYGEGFPKSLDVSKAIDNAADYRLQAVVRRAAVAAVEAAGLSLPGNSRWDWTVGEHAPGNKWWAEFQAWLPGLNDNQRDQVEREIVARVQKAAGWFTSRDIYNVTAPATDAAKQWDGWGTALKPAWEPIILARKPLMGTVAANVLEHGTGGLNIDGCRINPEVMRLRGDGMSSLGVMHDDEWQPESRKIRKPISGRWPANVVHDGSEEVVGLFPVTKSGQLLAHHNKNGGGLSGTSTFAIRNRTGEPCNWGGDSGSAARFFYCAKASQSERWFYCCDCTAAFPSEIREAHGHGHVDEHGRQTWKHIIQHPTQKPTALMRWLCRLVTSPNGLILDPFCGSGSTGIAAALEGFRFVGIDDKLEYCDIARKRIARASMQTTLI